MIKYIAYSLTFVLAMAFQSCGGHDSGSGLRQLTVSIEPLRALLDPLARGRFEIVSIMDRGSDPENFEPSMSRRMAVDGSEAFFITGALPFETSLADAVPQNVRVISLSKGIKPIFGTHDHCGHNHDGHHHGMPDPHIWTSVRNARVIAATMAATLSSLDPQGADIYAARLDSLTAHLDSIDSYVAHTLDLAPSRAFIVWHPSLSYMARDYGLDQVALGAEGKDFSASGIRDAAMRAASAGAKVFFVQRGLDPAHAQNVCDAAGTRPVDINPMAYDWNEQLKHIADELARH